jgi:hypothetical protein
MSQDIQAAGMPSFVPRRVSKLTLYHAVVEAPSVLLAFIHDEPTLPERLAFSEEVKQNHQERLENMEKGISKLVDAV